MNTSKSSVTIGMVLVGAGFGLYLSSTDTVLRSSHVFVAGIIVFFLSGLIEEFLKSNRDERQKRDADVTTPPAGQGNHIPKAASMPERDASGGQSAEKGWERYLAGNVRNQYGDTRGAIDCYTEAIEFDPACWKAYCNRGTLKACQKDVKGALLDLNKAIELRPDDPVSYCSRGTVRTHFDDHSGAVADYTRAIELCPNDPTYYSSRGNAKLDMRDFHGAVEDCSQAINLLKQFNRLLPENARMIAGNAHRIRAEARRNMGNFNGAGEDEKEAETVDPGRIRTKTR